MPVSGNPQGACLNHVLVIETQSDDGGPSGWGQTDDVCTAVCPGKMSGSTLRAWIEESRQFAGGVVGGVGFGPLELVTTIASSGQIRPLIAAASRAGDDVVDNQGHTNQPA